jgi:hypothetical protein
MIHESLVLFLAVGITTEKPQLRRAKEAEPGRSAFPFREPDRSRPAAMDDTEEFDQL